MKSSRQGGIGWVVAGFLLWNTVGTASAANLLWTNIASGRWDIATTANWIGDATVFNTGDNVAFTNAAGGNISILSTGVQPGTMLVNGAGTYTFSNEVLASTTINAGAGTLTKTGTGTAFFPAISVVPSVNFSNVTLTGGALQFGGAALVTATTNGFGTGAISIDNGASLRIFAASGSYPSFTNAINILPGSGTLDTRQMVGGWNPGVVFRGAIGLQGDINLVGGGNWQDASINLAGPVTLIGGNRAISNTTGAAFYRVSGAVSNDAPATPRRLTVTRGTASGFLIFSGDNTGLTGGITVSPGSGVVRFQTQNSLGGGGPGSVLLSNAYAAASFFTSNDTAMQTLLAMFDGNSAGVLGFDNSTTPYAGAVILTSLPNVRLGSSLWGQAGVTPLNQPYFSRINGAITPYGTTYKFGGGGGALVLGTNVLTGANRSLDVSIPAGQVSGAPNQIGIDGSQTYGGGTIVNTGAVLSTWGMGGNPFGTGPVIVYGTIGAAMDKGSFVGVDTSKIILMPGSVLALADDCFQANQNVGGSSGLATGRWGDSTPINLTSSTYAYRRNWSVATANEVVGALTFSGGSALSFNTGHAGEMNTLTAASLTRVTRGTLVIRDYTLSASVVLGGSVVASPGSQRVILSAGAGTSNGMLTVNGSIAPWLVDADKSTFVTYVVTGMTGVTYTVSGGTALNTPPTAADIVDQTGDITLNNNPAVYALRSAGAINNGIVTIGSGGLILTGAKTHTASFVFGVDSNAEAVIYASADNTFNSNIAANAGLTKFGSGKLTLSGSTNNSIAGNVYVQGGTLTMGSTNAATQMSNNVLTVNYGAVFNTGNFSVPVSALQGQGTLQLASTTLSRLMVGGGTGVVGAVTLEGPGYIAPGDAGVSTLTLSGLSTTDGLRLRSGELRIDLQSAQLYDVLSVGSTMVTISDTGYAGTRLVLNLGYTPTIGDLYKIVDVGGATAVVGQFRNGSSVSAIGPIGTYKFDILYNSALGGGDGNDVVLRCSSKVYPGTLFSVR